MGYLNKDGLTYLWSKIKEKIPTKLSELTNDSGFVTKDHTHDASDIASGTVPIARGGTGASDAATARANLGAASESHTHDYIPITGGTATGTITAPSLQTGTDEANYFQTKKMRGEGDADAYYHAVDFGYAGHNMVDFHEYGGTWNFYKNTGGTSETGTLVGSITPSGWSGGAALTGTPTAPTADAATSTTQIATTEFVHKAAGKLSFTSVSVASSAFVSDTTYTDFPYRASVALNGVTSSMFPEVVFSVSDAMSGVFAPAAQTYDGGVYIYANAQQAVTIPTILCWR